MEKICGLATAYRKPTRGRTYTENKTERVITSPKEINKTGGKHLEQEQEIDSENSDQELEHNESCRTHWNRDS